MLKRRIEWKTLGLMLACYSLWLLVGYGWYSAFWPLCVIGLPFLAAFHTSLQHETIHGHPTPFPLLNEFLVSLPLAMVFPYRRYRDLHLKHHCDLNLTDPYEDPESYFWPLRQYNSMRPYLRALFGFNNTFLGRLLIGPALTMVGFTRTEYQLLKQGEPGIRLAWLLHIIGLLAALAIVSYVFAMPVWVYFVFVVYPALSLTSMRSYAEHQAAENIGGRSAIVETNPALSLLYLNNNLHIVHHANPSLPWYEIPALYEERKELYLAANEHTLFRGYSEIARRFAFRSKQSVSHPFLHTEEVAAD